MKRLITIVSIIVLVLVFAGAYASSKKSAQAPAKEVPSAAKSSDDGGGLSGKVVETMNAGGYSYVSVEKNGKKTWVAIPQTNVTVGQQISFQPGQEMRGFTSKTLNRTFDSIIFSGGLMSAASSAGSQEKSVAAAKHGVSKASGIKPGEKISVEKAAGPDALTVGEVFAQSAKLDKKTVVIKAKVVKVGAGIMGKNWIHLQDGSGDAAAGTSDLVVTTQDLPAAGDIVTMKGTIAKDKDFGSGYKYSVIMENATIQR